jgi:hypothetical protein
MGSEKSGGNFLKITPSWVIPGTYLENLCFLNDKNVVDGVELLFFLYDDEIRAGFLRELPGIRDFAERFVFTAHLPDSLKEEHEELVGTLAPLVKHFIVHPAEEAGVEAEARLLETWMSRYGRRRFLLENTLPGRLEALLACFGGDAPICLDTAHLLLEGGNPADFARRYGGRISEVHLNGTGGGDGHKPPRAGDQWFLELLPFLRRFRGMVNLEVFSWDEVQQGIDCLEKYV